MSSNKIKNQTLFFFGRYADVYAIYLKHKTVKSGFVLGLWVLAPNLYIELVKKPATCNSHATIEAVGRRKEELYTGRAGTKRVEKRRGQCSVKSVLTGFICLI